MFNNFMSYNFVVRNQAKILSIAVERALAATLRRREALDSMGHEDTPLTILSGENHSYSLHHMFHIAFLKRLSEVDNSIGVLYEFEHDRITREYKEQGFEITPKSIAALKKADANGYLSLRTSYRSAVGAGHYSRDTLFHYLKQSGLPVCFNDASRPVGFYGEGHAFYLDYADPTTRRSVEQSCYDTIQPRRAVDPEGMHARNQHMADKLNEFAEQFKARFLYQQCGQSHILGTECYPTSFLEDPRNVYPETHSLSHKLRQRDLPFLAIWHMQGEISSNQLTHRTELSADEVVLMPRLLTFRAVYNEDDQVQTSNPFCLESHETEAELIRVVLDELGCREFAIDIEDYLYARELSQLEKQCVFRDISSKEFGLG